MADKPFDWSDEKARSNFQKHGVTFEEGITIYNDPRLIRIFDLKHLDVEDREIAIGLSERLRILMVVTTERHETIRVINARRATKAEARLYARQGRRT